MFDVKQAVLPPADPNKKDHARKFLSSVSFVSEPVANLLGETFKALVPEKRYFMIFIILVVLNIMSSILIFRDDVVLSSPVTGFREGVLYYIFLASLLFWHEIGHCAAARKFNVRVDDIGGGLYLIFPAFFSRISLLKLLSFRERIIVFSTGIMFQLYASILMGTVYFFNPWGFLKYAIMMNFILVFLNLLPIFHLDGYRILEECLKQIKREKIKQVIFSLCLMLTIAVIGFFVFMMGSFLLRLTPLVFTSPSWMNILQFSFVSLILVSIGLSIPKWLKKPHG
ncbi:MAG: M50 family metallopeptidase [Robiginitomaculum sp.]